MLNSCCNTRPNLSTHSQLVAPRSWTGRLSRFQQDMPHTSLEPWFLSENLDRSPGLHQITSLHWPEGTLLVIFVDYSPLKIIPMTSSQSCWNGSVYVWQIPRFKIVDVHCSNMFLSCPAFPVDFTIFLTAFSLDPQRQRTNDSCLWATFSPRYKRDNPRNGDLFTRGISYWVVKNYEWPVKMSATCSLSSCKHLAVLKRTHIRCFVAGMHLPRI